MDLEMEPQTKKKSLEKIEITPESCRAGSNALLGKGPRVDYTIFKAHVPEHVTKAGEIISEKKDAGKFVPIPPENRKIFNGSPLEGIIGFTVYTPPVDGENTREAGAK